MKTCITLLKLFAPALPTMLLALLAAWLCMLTSIGLMASAAYLIARAALHPMIYELSIAIVAVRFFGISRAVLRYAERYISHDATFRILTNLRIFCYACLEKIAPAKLVGYKSGELFGLLIEEIDVLKDFYLRVLSPPLTAVLTLATISGILFFYSPTAAIWLIMAFIMIGLGLPYLAYHFNRSGSTYLREAKGIYKSECIDIIHGLNDIKVFHYDEKKFAISQRIANKITTQERKVFRTTALADAGADLIANWTLLAILACLIPLVRSNQISGIHLAVFTLAVQSSFEAVLPLPSVWHYCLTGLDAAKNLFKISQLDIALHPTAKTHPNCQGNKALLIDKLDFFYKPDAPVFKNLSFSIAAGEKIAIVGASGSGKSTLFNLLLRLWEQNFGMLYLNNVPYDAMTGETVRQAFRAITQNTYIFQGTIADNFRILYPDCTEAEILTALQKAQLHDFILSLQNGIHTDIGEDGNQLSGGQRQRLAIARALCQPAPILLLDEPTASLDSITAHHIMDTIIQTLDNRTMLLITHDLRGLASMDRILVLKDGQVIEQGSYHELLRKKGEFSTMLTYQQAL
ncbi:thiol reductant ABC exporter subunit CydC [Propionispira raffinosivorans]|uniref:thiol reductant ABC exporter subunit CydC n=1 Tax=Propionispira raffinosivorans TaxID=86959 RepID=UPI00035FA43A|nr:thiol reductant ABC exporter subunit CydC [Propionispira raffinosivorans]